MGGTQTRQLSVGILNDITANIFSTVSLTCSADNVADQTISASCTPPVNLQVSPPYPAFEENAACKLCISNVLDSQNQYYAQVRQTWSYQKIGVNLPIDTDYATVVQKMIACGTQCKACVFQNLSQSTTISETTTCKSLTSLKNSLDQKLTDGVTQALTNNQDALSGLANLFGASTTQSVVSNVVNRMSTKLTSDVITAALNTIQSNQTMILSGPGNIQGQTQTSVYSSVLSFLQQTDIMNTVLQDSEWTALQTLINDQNTINTLGNSTVKTLSDITRFIQSGVGKIVLFMVILVCFVFFVLIIVISVQYIRKKVAEAKKKEIDNEKNEDLLQKYGKKSL